MKYGFLSDIELLSLFDEKRSCSPIIDELCHRLESLIYKEKEKEVIPIVEVKKCPICESKIG